MFFDIICLKRLNVLTIKLCGSYNLSFETKVFVYQKPFMHLSLLFLILIASGDPAIIGVGGRISQ